MLQLMFLTKYLNDLIEELFVVKEDRKAELIEHVRHIRDMLNFEEQLHRNKNYIVKNTDC